MMDKKYCSKCGCQIEVGSRFCSSCGFCLENNEKQNKLKSNYFSIATKIVFVLVILFFGLKFLLQNEKVDKYVNKELPKKELADFAPHNQKELMSIVFEYKNKYASATNELQKTDLRKKRDIETARFAMTNIEVENWVGVIEGIGTEADGKAYFKVILPKSSIVIKTYNNSFSDLFTKTMVQPGASLYNSLFNLKNGDKVVFSGKFIEDKRAGIEEISLTEEGKMNNPEFIMNFGRIAKTDLNILLNTSKENAQPKDKVDTQINKQLVLDENGKTRGENIQHDSAKIDTDKKMTGKELSEAKAIKELEDKKKKCPDTVLAEYNMYGTYLKHDIAGDGIDAITITTNSGTTFTAYYAPDDPDYEKIKGKQLELKIIRAKHWSDGNLQCVTEDLCNNIKILNDLRLTNNTQNDVEKFLLAKQFSFTAESVDKYIDFYADEVLFYNQKLKKDKLRKTFEAYTSKWVKRNEKLERIDSIKKLDNGNLEVTYTVKFSHGSTDGACFSGIATTRACLSTVKNNYVIIEENKVSTIRDTPPKCW